ncbi:MAG: hypothetical protein LBF67_03580, partial [Prevotellaceae bacterium]|nr:hypothetical protein [Prevotellaceae bacterium]
MKTILRRLLLLAIMTAGGTNVWGEIRTITITVNSIESGNGTLGNSYNSGAEKTWTQDGVSFAGKAIMKRSDTIQAQASSGVLYNTTSLPGRIVSIELYSTGTARSSSCYGGTSRLVDNVTGNYTVSGGTLVGSASETGWSAEDFSETAYTFFAIKRGSTGAAYWTSVVITYEIPDPSVILSPGALAFGTKLINTRDTLKLNIKGLRLTNDVTVSVGDDTAGVFSVPDGTVAAEEAMSSKGKDVAVVFSPVHLHSYGGTLRISGADFHDTTLALTGIGGVPTFSADSTQVRFGKLAQG